MYNINDTSQHNDKIEISDETKIYIIDKLVEPYYKSIIKNTIQGRLCWRKSGIAFETISKIMVAFGSILSFSAGFYHDETLSFISGSISCLSLAFLQLSSFSYKENKKQSEELNILLKKLKLDTIPIFERQTETQARAYQSRQVWEQHNPYNPYNSYNSYNTPIPYNSSNEYNPKSSFSQPERSTIPIRKSSINNYEFTDNDINTIKNIIELANINNQNSDIDIEAQKKINENTTETTTENTTENTTTEPTTNETPTESKLNIFQKTMKYLFEKNKDDENDDE